MSSVAEQTKNFLSVPFNRYLVAALIILGGLVFLFDPAAQQMMVVPPSNVTNVSANLTIHFFYSPTCPHCAAQKPFNEQIANEFPQVSFVYHDVTYPAEIELLREMYEEYGLDTTRIGVPTTFIGKRAIVGFSEKITPNEIRMAIINCLETCANQTAELVDADETKKPTTVNLPFLGETNIAGMSLPVLAVVLGLADGFNPCAMWVLVYLIALVMETGLKDPKRIWLIVGTFVFASGVLYFLFMTAWLNIFLMLGYVRAVTILIGLIALGGGTLSVKEYIETRGGTLKCEIVGEEEKEKTMGRMQQLVSAPISVATIIGIVALAFVVNSVEFVCSSAIPAIFTQVLALSNLAFWQHYLYIAVYDFFYMLDDLIIFGLAAFAVAGGVGDRYAKYSKAIGGSILLILGVVLLFAPNLLR